MAFGGVWMAEFVVTDGAISSFRSSDIAERGFCDYVERLTYEASGATASA